MRHTEKRFTKDIQATLGTEIYYVRIKEVEENITFYGVKYPV